ncbi:platelet-activating factor acetylhydrolase, isoform II-domain-containing protein [Chaetomium strumarium]|uniref:Putative phospholipase n=1 Tax=Chaetomium strumarium TaxID=1170767 RepID=A0AAJ0H2E0_9PEZI|nr:platelet-activating factor acetylhydrolase, isoform II-domain-containing protein [Chaetomium strumarium]
MAQPSSWDHNIRPFLRWRYIPILAGLTYVLYRSLNSLPLFSHPLPQHTGPYAVGAVDIEAPVSQARITYPARFKDTKEDVFELQTVLFTLYYPADHRTTDHAHARRHTWIPEPLSLRAQGYAKAAHINNWLTDTLFAGALRALAGSVTIPAAVDVPLSSQASPGPGPSSATDSPRHGDDQDSGQKVLASREEEQRGFPVIVFSHGTTSSRRDYSHYAGELAARGYVVAMLEHRDGSCPGSVIKARGQRDRKRLIFDVSEVESLDGAELSVEDFHSAQLNFREAEIEEAVRVIRMINSGHGTDVFNQNPRGEGSHLAKWAGRLNTDGMIIAGHSYGATGALQALRNWPNDKLPFKGAIILDPGKQSGPLNRDINVPVLVVHSNSWSSKTSIFYGRAHFDTVEGIVTDNNGRGNPSWFMTSLGTSHPSVTDAPLIEPFLLSFTTGATINVYQGLRQYVHVAEDFLLFLADGTKRGLLAEKAEFPKYDPGTVLGMWKPGQGGNDTQQDEWFDWRSYWQIHVSPVS